MCWKWWKLVPDHFFCGKSFLRWCLKQSLGTQNKPTTTRQEREISWILICSALFYTFVTHFFPPPPRAQALSKVCQKVLNASQKRHSSVPSLFRWWRPIFQAKILISIIRGVAPRTTLWPSCRRNLLAVCQRASLSYAGKIFDGDGNLIKLRLASESEMIEKV